MQLQDPPGLFRHALAAVNAHFLKCAHCSFSVHKCQVCRWDVMATAAGIIAMHAHSYAALPSPRHVAGSSLLPIKILLSSPGLLQAS